MDPLIGFALAHAEQASLDHLERVSFHIGQNKHEPILRGRQWTVLVHAKPAGRPGLPIEAPCRHMGLECRLKGRDELLKLVKRETGQIQELCWASLHVGELYTGHPWGLLSWEAQYTTNRDELNSCSAGDIL